MTARAPEAIQHLWTDINERIGRAQLGGIVGDTAHSFGYHLARRDLPASDYSVQLGLDRMGASDCASALDVTLPPELMKTCTKRLLAAAKARDPRLRGLREFCGTLDGSRTYPWDLSTNSSEGIDSWDDSHLWHIHLSFYRAFADDYDVLAPIADVITGQTQEEDPLAGITVAEIAHAVWAYNQAGKRRQAWAYLQDAADPADIADAIIAKLPAGALTKADVEAAVRAVFADASTP